MKRIPAGLLIIAAADEFWDARCGNGCTAPINARPYWWKDDGLDNSWCGVFQGGGAKGAAYVGALCAWADQDQWFTEVAGSSAGAITAALIAAGYHPNEMLRITQVLMRSIVPDSGLNGFFYSSWLFRWLVRYQPQEFEKALEVVLAAGIERYGDEESGPVTFARLERATGIRLTVVVLDASGGHPLPFCPQWCPDLPVASAVVASCSIPVLFSAPYLEVAPNPGPRWRRMVDGGVFANFPSFVYDDEGFREYYELGDLSPELRKIGFTMGALPKVESPPKPQRFVTNPRHIIDSVTERRGTSRYFVDSKSRLEDRRASFLALALSGNISPQVYEECLPKDTSAGVQAFKAVAGTLLSLSLQLAALYWTLSEPLSHAIAHAEAGRVLPAILDGVTVISRAFFFVVGRRLVLRIAQEGTTVIRTWMGQSLRPPMWMGAVKDSFLIFVPSPGLSVVSFSAPAHLLREAAWVGYMITTYQTYTVLDEGLSVRHQNLLDYAAEVAKRSAIVPQHKNLPTHPYERPWTTRVKDFVFG